MTNTFQDRPHLPRSMPLYRRLAIAAARARAFRNGSRAVICEDAAQFTGDMGILLKTIKLHMPLHAPTDLMRWIDSAISACDTCEAKNQENKMQIESGIPIPPRRFTPRKHPWEQMKVGDSLLFKLRASSVSPQVSKAARAFGFKFETHKTPEGIRVWRTG